MKKEDQVIQSEHWADILAKEILEWQTQNKIENLHVDDMKTPSGRVHVGALRGVVLHDIVAKVLAEHTDQKVTSTYIFNDMDEFKKIPQYLPADKYQAWISKPLHKMPAPTLEDSGIDFSDRSPEDLEVFENATSYAQFYALDFIQAFRYLGCSQELVWSHELYESGKMNEIIDQALANLPTLKKIYSEIADYDLPQDWIPYRPFDLDPHKRSVRITNWDGENLTFESLDVDGNILRTQTIKPHDGNGKLLWKVDWPAHWKALGITIEGAGKDHTSAGGSRDMANAQCEQVFEIPKPYDIPYEWILIRGTKMSSSKGIGTSAREFVMLFPPEIGRFLFVNKHYNQVIDFDPRTMAIPDLFDEYDQAARIHWKEEDGDQRMGRAFVLSQTGATPEPHFLPRFRDIATWMQHPEMELSEKFAEIKGQPLSEMELAVLKNRLAHAQVWLDNYAPEEFQLTPKEELPEAAKTLSAEQIEFVEQIVDLSNSKEWDGAEFQQAIFDAAKDGLGARKAFQALYLAFIGKTHGPRAGWFMLGITPDLRAKRVTQLKEISHE